MSYTDLTTMTSGPNAEVLEAQARVCTGPNQSRPLGVKQGDPDPDRVLSIVVDSLEGRLRASEAASRAQIGAFLGAMTLREQFQPTTAWSDAEKLAMRRHADNLQSVDPATRFLLSPTAPTVFEDETDKVLADALSLILRGRHLTYQQTRSALSAVMSTSGDDALKAAILIGQRMNHESDEEFRAYLDSVVSPEGVQSVDVPSLTTIGEPYNGSTRYFKPTCFVAAVRAALGRPTLLHGVDFAPPKSGITESQILDELGACTRLTPDEAVDLIAREDVGFAYLSQAEFAPHAYRMLTMRIHIQKRPTWAASEKAQQILKATGRNDMVVGYFHPGYEVKQLESMRDRGLDAGCVIKGEEGTSQLGLRSGAPSEGHKKTLNFAKGYRGSESFARDIDPTDLGFNYDQSPRLETITAAAFAEAGYRALRGDKGHIQDRIALNAGMIDWLLGYERDAQEAIGKARASMIDGSASVRLDNYVTATKQRAVA
jgi:anthranilate phosphoribosyltransferase